MTETKHTNMNTTHAAEIVAAIMIAASAAMFVAVSMHAEKKEREMRDTRGKTRQNKRY